MWIRRYGSQRFHDYTTIIAKVQHTNWRWRYEDDELILTVSGVADLHQSNVSYEYDIMLSLDDVVSLLGVLADEGVANRRDEIQEKFAPVTDKLFRLIMCGCGCLPPKKQAGPATGKS